MSHLFKTGAPANSIVVVTLFVIGLLLVWDESVHLSPGARLFFLIIAPLAVYHLHRITVSLQYFELTPKGISSRTLLRQRTLPFADIEHVSFSSLTGDLLLESRHARIAIPSTTEHFGELHFAIVTGVWAHQGVGDYELVMGCPFSEETPSSDILRPSIFERAHAIYAVSAPVVWATCLAWAAGPAWLTLLPLLLIGGVLQSALNFHGLLYLLNWYELRDDGLVVHSLLKERFLPAGDFLTSVVREDTHGRSLELAFLNRTVRIRFGFRMPVEELAGRLNQRWTPQET